MYCRGEGADFAGEPGGRHGSLCSSKVARLRVDAGPPASPEAKAKDVRLPSGMRRHKPPEGARCTDTSRADTQGQTSRADDQFDGITSRPRVTSSLPMTEWNSRRPNTAG